MVLCVSNVSWPEARPPQTRSPPEPHAQLELTDGWYRLRAEVDPPLERAIRRGVIRVGRKIALIAARVGFSAMLQRRIADEALAILRSEGTLRDFGCV